LAPKWSAFLSREEVEEEEEEERRGGGDGRCGTSVVWWA